MTLAQLQLFRDLALCRSFSKAAKENGVSQSAASQQVQEIERLVGAPLVNRATRPLALTSAGELFLGLARDVLRRKADFDGELAQLQQRTEGLVRVASIYSVGLSEMGRLEAEFADRCPGAHLAIAYYPPARIYAAIEADQADVGLVSYPEPGPEIEATHWREEQMVVAASPRHPLARRREVVPFELNGVDFVAFDSELPVRRAVDDYLEQQLVEVRVAFEFDNIALIKEAVALGNGVSILPRPILESDVQQGRLVAIPLASPGLTRPLGILTSKRRKVSPAAREFVRMLEEQEELIPLPVS
ncbi:MAG: LysR family transcriptional regulator [Bryobacteraceae bacterium]|nr:LysR family transcriptional regulator [Bryobacteraceae bacterium]